MSTVVGEADPGYRWRVLGIVMIGTLMSALDQSIVNVSLPNIMADFGAGIDDIEWVITGYMLAFAVFMPITTWLKDRIGHRILYLGSLVIFTAGSLLCGLAWNLPSLIAARVIQAIGGGAITPTGMTMISEVFPREERGKAIGYWGMGVIVGPALGPTLGGILTKEVGWRSIFLVNLPIGIIGFILGAAMLYKDVPGHEKKKPFDTWGFIFLSIFLVGSLLGLTKGDHEGWTSNYILTCFGSAVIGLVGFLTVESLVQNAIIDLTLFQYRIFTMAIILTAARSVALYGGTFLLPLFLQQVMGRDEIDSGLILLPGSLIIAAVLPFAGKFSDKAGARVPAVLGIIGITVFLYLYRTLDVNTSSWGVIWPTLVRGIGIGFLIAPITAAALNAVPPEKASMVSSMSNLIQQVAGSIGIALLGTVLSVRNHFHANVMGALVDPRNSEVQLRISTLTQHALNQGYTPGDSHTVASGLLMQHAFATGNVAAFDDAFLFGAYLVAFAVIPAFLLPGTPMKPLDKEHMVVE